MAESTKVRLVRCPKCENLLPELADYSVYQCGGCGAVLRAKVKNRDAGVVLKRSDEETVAEVAMETSLEKRLVESTDVSDADAKSDAGSLRCDEKIPENDDIGYVDECSKQPKDTSGKWVVGNDVDKKVKVDDLDSVVQREHCEMNIHSQHKGGSRRSGRMSGCQRGESSKIDGFGRAVRAEVEGVRFPASNYAHEGPSSYNLDSSYSFGEPLRDHDEQNAANRVQDLEKDRAELLRKLDELKEQLTRSYSVADKSKEKVSFNGRTAPPDPHGGSDTWFAGTSSISDRASMQFFAPDKHAAGPSYFSQHPEAFPYTNGHDMAMHGFHPSMHKSSQISGYGDPFGSQMLGKAPQPLSSQHKQLPHQHFSGRQFAANPVPFEQYPPNATFHQTSCSCFHCYEKHHEVSIPAPTIGFGNRRFPDVSSNPMMYHHEDLRAFGPHVHNARSTLLPPVGFCSAQSHTRWPSDLNSEMGGFAYNRPRKLFLASGGRCCRPVAGGSPFLTCLNCFELLQLPKKVLLMSKNNQKMRCGACSTVINFAVVNKKLVISVNTDAAHVPTEVDDGSNEMANGNASHSYGHMNRINSNFSSDDYDTSGYDFQTVDKDPITLNSSKLQEMQSFQSSSPITSDDENSPDVLMETREVIGFVQQPIKTSLSPPLPGSPLQQHFDYSSNNYAVNRFGKGNRSSRSDQEKVIPNKVGTRQNSMKEASLATEMEVSFHEYANTGVSEDSVDAGREDDSKTSKGSESFFANIIKKSFKDFSKSNQVDGRNNVSVNGHHIPDRLVKKAEKLAGPIRPGQYWYDYQAGFWGVMGGPCLGIIPPFIEEFNYSMPEDCAGGNTGVFVNGRELHKKDLDLLATRGLPTDRDRSYIVEISGKVLDKDTGEELDGLGKLAPTVERAKHGFGMKAKKAAAP